MQVIIISSNKATHKHWHFTLRHLFMFIALVLISMVTLLMTDFSDNQSPSPLLASTKHTEKSYSNNSETQQTELNSVNSYYAQRLGQLQAESIRLKVIAEKMAEVAGVDLSAFTLSEKPAQGGLEESGDEITDHDLHVELDALSLSLQQQDQQLAFLEDIYLVRGNITSAIPHGSPIKKGWISSGYGYRIDPFNGKKTMHRGLDFAGQSGSEVLAVADGIVSWTGKRSGYGQMIDIDHGNGYITRYAHNKKLIVKVGTRVQKGDAIALMGSTGRSTGPHVHFEILRDGKSINPYNFVKG